MSPTESFQRGQRLGKAGDLDGAARAYLDAYEAIREGEGSHSHKLQALASYVTVQQQAFSSRGEPERLRQAHAVTSEYLLVLRAVYAGEVTSVSGYSVAMRLLEDLDREMEVAGVPRELGEPAPAPTSASSVLPPSEAPRETIAPRPERAIQDQVERPAPASDRRLKIGGRTMLALGALSSAAFGISLGVGHWSSMRYREGPAGADRDAAERIGERANVSAAVSGGLAAALLVAGVTLLVVKRCRHRPTAATAMSSRAGSTERRCRWRMR